MMEEDNISTTSGASLGSASFVSYGSFDSMESAASVASMFWSEPPMIPHVDSYISNPAFKFENLNAPFIKAHANSKKKKKKREKKKKPEQILEDDYFIPPEQKRVNVTKEDVTSAFRFIDACGNNNNFVEIDEFELAFKKFRHSKLHHGEESFARELMKNFEVLLKLTRKDIKQWFEESDVRGNYVTNTSYHHTGNHATDDEHGINQVVQKGDGKISWGELKGAMRKLCTSCFAPMWSDDELLVLQRFMDPDGDGSLTLAEVRGSFKRLHMPAETTFIMRAAGASMDVLIKFMDENHLRVRDLFQQIYESDHEESHGSHDFMYLPATGATGGISLKSMIHGVAKIVSKANWAALNKEQQQNRSRNNDSPSNLMRSCPSQGQGAEREQELDADDDSALTTFSSGEGTGLQQSVSSYTPGLGNYYLRKRRIKQKKKEDLREKDLRKLLLGRKHQLRSLKESGHMHATMTYGTPSRPTVHSSAAGPTGMRGAKSPAKSSMERPALPPLVRPLGPQTQNRPSPIRVSSKPGGRSGAPTNLKLMGLDVNSASFQKQLKHSQAMFQPKLDRIHRNLVEGMVRLSKR